MGTAAESATAPVEIRVREDGDANFYQLILGKRWLAVVQLNGEFTEAAQREIMARLAAAFPPLTATGGVAL